MSIQCWIAGWQCLLLRLQVCLEIILFLMVCPNNKQVHFKGLLFFPPNQADKMTNFSVCSSSLGFSLSAECSGSPTPQLKVSISWHIWASQLKERFTFWGKTQSTQTLLYQKVPYLGSCKTATVLQLCLRGSTPQHVWRESLTPLSTGLGARMARSRFLPGTSQLCGSIYCAVRYYFKSTHASDSILDKFYH